MTQTQYDKIRQEEIERERALAREKALRDKISMQYMVEKSKAEAEEAKAEAERKVEAAEQKAEDAERKAEAVEQKAEAAEQILRTTILTLKNEGMGNSKIASLMGIPEEKVKQLAR